MRRDYPGLWRLSLDGALRLRYEGLSYQAIADELEISKSYAYLLCKRQAAIHGKLRGPEELAAKRQEYADACYRIRHRIPTYARESSDEMNASERLD